MCLKAFVLPGVWIRAMASKEELLRAVEALLRPATQADGSVSLEDVEKTLVLVREFKEKFQSLEQTLLQSPEGVAVQVDRDIRKNKDRITTLRAKLDKANQHIEKLTGKRKHEMLRYEYVPEGRRDKDEYSKQLNNMRSEASKAMAPLSEHMAALEVCAMPYARRHEDTRETLIQRDKEKLQALDRQFKNSELNYLQSCVPIDVPAFHAKLHPLLDAKLQALRELRALELEGVDVGDV
jgi:hypothetical protein